MSLRGIQRRWYYSLTVKERWNYDLKCFIAFLTFPVWLPILISIFAFLLIREGLVWYFTGKEAKSPENILQFWDDLKLIKNKNASHEEAFRV